MARRAHGGITGLDYAGVRAAAEAIGVDWGKVFEEIRILESELLEAMRERG